MLLGRSKCIPIVQPAVYPLDIGKALGNDSSLKASCVEQEYIGAVGARINVSRDVTLPRLQRSPSVHNSRGTKRKHDSFDTIELNATCYRYQ